MRTLKKKQKTTLIIGALAALVIIIAIGYAVGYRLDGWRVAKAGDVVIHLPEASSETESLTIAIDENEMEIDDPTIREFKTPKLVPGTHTIIVARNDTWPWQKNIDVSSDEITNVRPFLVSREPDWEAIQRTEDPERYGEVVAFFNDQPELVTSEDRTIELTQENDRSLRATWIGGDNPPSYLCEGAENCPNPTAVVFTVEEEQEIRSFGLYKGRNDVMIIASSNGIFAIDMNSRPTRNLHPIYMGTEPEFAASPDDRNIIYIRDISLPDMVVEITL